MIITWTIPRTGCSALRSAESAYRAARATAGNLATPLLHGTTYFDRLVAEVEDLDEGDHLFFTDWRGDPDQLLRPDGTDRGAAVHRRVKRGDRARPGLALAHGPGLDEQGGERALDDEIEHSGGEVILDQRIRRLGSHHQKFVVLRHDDDPSRDVAFVGGIDLCHGRRDDAEHHGDPQSVPMARAYGERPPWHDVQLEVRGPPCTRWTRSSGSAGTTPTAPTRTTRSPGSTTSCTTPGCTRTR